MAMKEVKADRIQAHLSVAIPIGSELADSGQWATASQ